MGKLQIQPRGESRDAVARRCQKPLPPPTQSVLSETGKGKHRCLVSTWRISFKPASKPLSGEAEKVQRGRTHFGIFMAAFTLLTIRARQTYNLKVKNYVPDSLHKSLGFSEVDVSLMQNNDDTGLCFHYLWEKGPSSPLDPSRQLQFRPPRCWSARARPSLFVNVFFSFR